MCGRSAAACSPRTQTPSDQEASHWGALVPTESAQSTPPSPGPGAGIWKPGEEWEGRQVRSVTLYHWWSQGHVLGVD